MIDKESEFIGSDFIYTNSKTAIPYLIMICLATFFGTVGNVFIIGAVCADKVIILLVFDIQYSCHYI